MASSCSAWTLAETPAAANFRVSSSLFSIGRKKKRLTACVCVWVGVCALPFIVCARCFESASTLYRRVFLFMQHNLFFFFYPHIIIIPLLLHCEASSALVNSSHSSAHLCTVSPVGSTDLTPEQLHLVPQHMPSYVSSVKRSVILRSSGLWRWIILRFVFLAYKEKVN